MRTLFSYYGGKQRLAARIVDYLPRHTVYVEPFCGSAAVFFAKPRPQPSNHHHYREVLNDHNQRIITIFRVAQDPVLREALLDRLTYTPYSRAEHQRSRAIQQTWPTHDVVTQAWAMLVDLQQSFASKVGGGWGTCVFSECHASTWTTWCEVLPALCARLQDVYLECDDALAVIRRWDSPQTCFYCDPPYVGASQGHYAGYTAGDFKALIEVLSICQGSVVLSGYASPSVPSTWECLTIDAYCSSSAKGIRAVDRTRAMTTEELGDRTRLEHLWRIDRSAHMRPELQALFAPKHSSLPLFDEDEASSAGRGTVPGLVYGIMGA